MQALRSASRGMWCAIPGVIASFDATKQTAVINPALTDSYTAAGNKKTKSLPQLVDVPIVLPRGGGFTLTVPIAAGDECLVVFADMAIDAWYQSGAANGPQNQVIERRHSLADGFAILGPWNQPRVLASYSTTSAQLRNDAGTVVVDLAGSQITVTAPTVQVNASSQATVTSPTVQVNASSQAQVTAPTVNVSGSTAVNITGGHCSIDGKNFLTHTHSDVSSGGGISGPVV